MPTWIGRPPRGPSGVVSRPVTTICSRSCQTDRSMVSSNVVGVWAAAGRSAAAVNRIASTASIADAERRIFTTWTLCHCQVSRVTG